MEELSPILSVPYKCQSSQHNSLVEINVCCKFMSFEDLSLSSETSDRLCLSLDSWTSWRSETSCFTEPTVQWSSSGQTLAPEDHQVCSPCLPLSKKSASSSTQPITVFMRVSMLADSELIRAWAGLNLRGSYCFSNYQFFVPNDRIKLTKLGIYITSTEKFHNQVSSSISNTRWRFHQGKCILSYISHILYRIFKNISTHSLNCAESHHIGHCPFSPPFCRKVVKCCKPTFSNSSQAISPMCTKLCTQHLWTLLTKSYQKNFDISDNTQVIK